MRPAVPSLLLLAVLGLTGCGGGADPAPEAAPVNTPTPTGYSQEVRGNFLDSCLDNATNSAKGATTEEQLTQTCECILGKVEQEYSQTEFADFEKRLLGGTASDEERGQLVNWSTECAQTATS
ncbi:MAG: hypothetical protein JWM62_240 [Frankiales bacterium]|jgi:hypothetical protein|nr:hypothetical protein [Frankiales bacterium]